MAKIRYLCWDLTLLKFSTAARAWRKVLSGESIAFDRIIHPTLLKYSVGVFRSCSEMCCRTFETLFPKRYYKATLRVKQRQKWITVMIPFEMKLSFSNTDCLRTHIAHIVHWVLTSHIRAGNVVATWLSWSWWRYSLLIPYVKHKYDLSLHLLLAATHKERQTYNPFTVFLLITVIEKAASQVYIQLK